MCNYFPIKQVSWKSPESVGCHKSAVQRLMQLRLSDKVRCVCTGFDGRRIERKVSRDEQELGCGVAPPN